MSVSHPLDEMFGVGSGVEVDIDSEYSAMTTTRSQLPEPVEDTKDEDDKIVEARLDEVWTSAMEVFNQQTDMIEIIEPRYAARTAEVAAQYLRLALDAANSRAKNKNDRRKNQQFVPYSQNGGGKNTTNIIMANREDILKAISIDGQSVPM